jgi:hypothetical protein
MESKLKVIDLYDPLGHYGLNPALEKEGTFEELLKQKTFFGRIGLRFVKHLVNHIGYMPSIYFEKEDVDRDVVHALLAYPDLLIAVAKWIENNDYSQMPQLREAKKVFDRIHHPKKRGNQLYRGFNLDTGQQHHGLKGKLDELKPGEKFKDIPEKLTSFSSYSETTKAYGTVMVSVDYAKEDKRMFHITNEVMVAYFMNEDGAKDFDKWFTGDRIFSYFESVFIPDGKPLEFTLVHK